MLGRRAVIGAPMMSIAMWTVLRRRECVHVCARVSLFQALLFFFFFSCTGETAVRPLLCVVVPPECVVCVCASVFLRFCVCSGFKRTRVLFSFFDLSLLPPISHLLCVYSVHAAGHVTCANFTLLETHV